MSTQSIYRYLFVLTISLLFVCCSASVFAQADTVAMDTTTLAKIKKKDSAGHQLCIGIDVFHPVINQFLTGRRANELEFDYYLHNEFYAAMECGWGGSDVNYPDLIYSTKNTFIRLGFNKTILPRDNPKDWDMMFFGLRVGVADIKRTRTTFNVTDSLWGNTIDTSIAPSHPFVAVWAELTAGMRVAVIKNIFAGWNIRGKFMMNGKSLSDPTPLYIAGYGRGDKNTAFDFNVYISYAIRWNRKSLGKIDEEPGLPATTKPEMAPGNAKEKNGPPGSK